MFHINHINFFLIHVNVCAQKSLKCTCPASDPVTPLMYKNQVCLFKCGYMINDNENEAENEK